MPALQVDNAALLRIIWAVSDVDSAVNVYGLSKPPGVAITQALVNAVGTALRSGATSSGLVAQQSPLVRIATVGIRDINEPNQPEITDNTAGPIGTGTNPPLPPQTALVVTLRTALAGRRFRGRSYVFGWASNANTGAGVATQLAADAATTWIQTIRADVSASGLELAVISRPVWSDDPIPILIRAGEVHPITGVAMRNHVWDTQRRRAIPGI
jgi:hypothetical protein